MNKRILLKEIPAGKFHSVIFTTYSLNLYYLEQQVIPLLGGKGIHYISILADSNMLSSQLEEYSTFSQDRKRNYSVHGIKSNGAFHPKLIFLAGQESLLLLLGSGNLTSSGHGKNLEIWNPIYVSTSEDPKYAFVIQTWHYLKYLHSDLGDSAKNKIKSIEENCLLLNDTPKAQLLQSYKIDNKINISFIRSNTEVSLFDQLTQIIGSDRIERITIMSPFYDASGNFILELDKKFKPEKINIILQEEFGVSPYKMKPKPNIYFYDWMDIQKKEHKQQYFHAKNIVLEGRKKNYLVTGSANASMAAFGSPRTQGVNHETCIVYQSKVDDYVDILELKLKKKTVKLSAYKPHEDFEQSQSDGHRLPVFIKSVEKKPNQLTLFLTSSTLIEEGTVCLYDSLGQRKVEKTILIDKGDSAIKVEVHTPIHLIYAEILVSGQKASNKQFVIDIDAFEGTNPSPRNRSLNEIRKLIEYGDFSTSKIIDYLTLIHKQKESGKKLSSLGSISENKNDDLSLEDESDLLYLSYEEIQERANQLVERDKPTHYLQYKGVRLWESIFLYLKENREREVQKKIDEEETEDLNRSTGRETKPHITKQNSISKSDFQRLENKIDRFLRNYENVLTKKNNDTNVEKPNLIDLAMFLIILEILLHLFSHKEKIKEDGSEQYLLYQGYKFAHTTWSEFLIIFIGRFTMWINQKNGFQDSDSFEYRQKLILYQKMAFKTSISCLSLFGLINDCDEIPIFSNWLKLCLLNINKSLNAENSNYPNVEEFLEFYPQKVIEEFGEGILCDEIESNLSSIKSYKQKTSDFKKGNIYLHPEHGYTIIGKVISNHNNVNTFMLYHTGYEWDEDVRNYWNRKYVHL